MDAGDEHSMAVNPPLFISDDEIHAARYDWLAARDADADVPPERVALLFEYYRALISLQARQLADEFRARRGRA
ncbi:hypothetical protein [Cellulomonas sp. NTE-D12]|uniref:hypothetical protein n=1 Tax=Cellulomonas sp. NTE-D12 TaxID=2962632 RepID=UPI0030818FB3|nr:hypothetical protein CELD12_01070 [Cellulomonas sp. NTE-D12]